ncbi:Gfo/Idh/MocA family protein [Natrialba taiwanensis]|uniref:Dehydrogenase n=1 Tax=Natrialba taiwanensis DSM 12281 TaxID=1230458 RepID=L9ZZ04_9EURY|nr:Gfo/Idh/MocA family oxidoreductase [Natrialba taiwanensis]ELY91539.1 dehydrogenase [Natrialba taiwanensis DSM 12281]
MQAGIAGAGFMARTHLKAYRKLDVEIAAVSSPSGPEETIKEFGLEAEAYTDVGEMCKREDLDFLDVCTPTHTHVPIVETAVESGLDVFLEKPVASSLADARELAAFVDDADATCMVGHVIRFLPAYRRARELDIGSPGVARARRLSPFPDWGSDGWFADPEKSGGVFVDLAIHDLDYLRWCWGPVERVFARTCGEADSAHGFATLRFENGAVGYVEASWAQPSSRSLTSELELAGDDGLVEFSSEDGEPYVNWTEGGSTVERPLATDGYWRELDHFISSLESDSEPEVDLEEAVESLRLALAARRSAERGKPVSPTEVGR